MKLETICVLGGTGFVGRHVVTRLANCGYRIKVLTRHPERHRDLTLRPGVTLAQGDVRELSLLEREFAGQDAVINLVGILNESAGHSFREMHVEVPRRIVDAVARNRVRRVLHMSALNADAANGASDYLRSKGEGEQVAHLAAGAGAPVTSFRPSVIFGRGDGLFGRFAGLMALTPVLPLACPDARFAPVYVGDVAAAFLAALRDPATQGKRIELCGPRDYSLLELVRYTAALTGRRRLVVGLSDGLSRLQAQIFDRLPGRPFSLDNYRSLQVDSVCQCNGLEALGIQPASVESVMPRLIGGADLRLRLNDYRARARRS